MARKLLILLLVLMGCVAPGCGLFKISWPAVWVFETQAEIYYLAGQPEITSKDGSALDAADKDIALGILGGIWIDAGIFYHLTYKNDHTQLKSGQALCSLQPAPPDIHGQNFYHLSDDASGSLTVVGDNCTLDLAAESPPAGYTNLKLTGVFNRKQAQTAIDRLRKSRRESGFSWGTERFDIDWHLTGEFEGTPFDLSVSQVFGVVRNEYSSII